MAACTRAAEAGGSHLARKEGDLLLFILTRSVSLAPHSFPRALLDRTGARMS